MHAIHDPEASIYRNNHLLSLNFLKNLFRFQSSSCPERLATMSDDSVRSTRSSARKTGRINYAERDTSGTEWVQPPVSPCVFCCCIFTFTVPDSCEVRLFFSSTLHFLAQSLTSFYIWCDYGESVQKAVSSKYANFSRKKLNSSFFVWNVFKKARISETWRWTTTRWWTEAGLRRTIVRSSRRLQRRRVARNAGRSMIWPVRSVASLSLLGRYSLESFEVLYRGIANDSCKAKRLHSKYSCTQGNWPIWTRKLIEVDRMVNWIVDWQIRSGNSSNNFNDSLDIFNFVSVEVETRSQQHGSCIDE